MSLDYDFSGLEGASQKLSQLSNNKVAKRIARKAGRQAMNIVRDAARENAKSIDDPTTVEKIHKNITVQSGKTRSANDIKIRVGINGGAGQNQHSTSTAGLSGGDTRHWRFIEFGTSLIQAYPFMRLALSKNIQAVTDKFIQVFTDEIDKELASL